MEEDFEKFIAKTKNVVNDPNIDKELDELMKDDPELLGENQKKDKLNDSSI